MARPKKERAYNRDWVKVANERLRKLESVHNFNKKQFPKLYDMGISFSNLSAEYRMIERYAGRQDEKGKIYRTTEDGRGIRFINKTEYDKLTDAEKDYFNKTLQNFLESETSTKTGVLESYKKAYETFKANHDAYSGMTFEDYMQTWKVYHDQIMPDKQNHFSYSRFTQLLESGNFTFEMLTGNQAEEVRNYIQGGDKRYSNIGHKFRMTNRHGKMADRARRRPNRGI